MAARAGAGGRKLSRSEGPDRAAAAAHGLRKRGLSQCWRVLESAHRYLHDAGECVHAALRILRGAEGRAAAGGLRRAGARGRSGLADGAEVRGDHQRQPRRPSRRRRGIVRDGDPRHTAARSRMRRRGADSGFSGQSGGGGDGDGGGARRVEPQYGNGAAAVPPGAPGRALRALARTCCSTRGGCGRRRPRNPVSCSDWARRRTRCSR